MNDTGSDNQVRTGPTRKERVMDQTVSDHRGHRVGYATGRREAVSALGVLGLGMLTTLGTTQRASARKKPGKKKRNSTRLTPVPGPAGPPGAQGPAGSPATISIVRGPAEEFSVAAGGGGFANSRCPGSSQAISRRINIVNPRCGIATDGPGVAGNEWSLAVKCPPGESSSLNIVEVVCLDLG